MPPSDLPKPPRTNVVPTGEAEYERAGTRDTKKRGGTAPRSVAIERDAERKLCGGERKEISAREQAKIRGRKTEVGAEIPGDHRVHEPVEVGEEIARRERAEHDKHGVHG